MRKIACLVVLGLLASGCGGSNATNAEPGPRQTTQASTASGSPTPGADPVGEWLWANTCKDLVEALAKAGLQEFAAQSVGGAVLLTTPENVPAKDPKDPCADAAGPIEQSHKLEHVSVRVHRRWSRPAPGSLPRDPCGLRRLAEVR